MRRQLLLLEDVDGLGRQGDVVTPKPGFTRNYLLPQKKAVVADKNTLRMRSKLQAEREVRAAVDRKEAEAQAAQLVGLVVKTEVKVDTEGKMYGSVPASDIVKLLADKGFSIERRQILLSYAIKALGTHTINLRLKESVPASFKLEVLPEGGKLPEKKELPDLPAAEKVEEASEV